MSNQVADIKALVAFGRLGVELAGMRLLSLVSLLGMLFLAWWVASTPAPAWQSVVVVMVVALCFLAAVRAESGQRHPPAQGS